MSDELTLLKQQADQLGVPYSNNIGIEALKKRVADKLEGKPDKPDGTNEGDEKSTKTKKTETEQERTQRIRQELITNETRLIRCRIACMNPAKSALKGEVITVGNKYIGTIRKLVPFDEAGESYHLPKILVDDLKAREFNQVKTRKGEQPGQVIVEQRMVKEYNIVELPPLTKEELKDLAAAQAAAAGQS